MKLLILLGLALFILSRFRGGIGTTLEARETPGLNISTIADIQAALNQLGYGPLAVDGILGPLTENAIMAFQADYGLLVDGIPGIATKAKLQELLL